MKITPNQNNAQLNFGSVNLVQVSKKAFKNPDDLIGVSKIFDNAVSKETGEMNVKLATALTLLGFGKKSTKALTFLEQPCYPNMVSELKKEGSHLSLSWLSQHLGIPIAKPLSETHHSFYVYTKEQKDASSGLFSAKQMYTFLKGILKEGFENIKAGKSDNIKPVWTATKLNEKILNELKPIITNEPVHKFVIDDLSELPKVFKEIDY